MARDGRSRRSRADATDMMEQFQIAISGYGPSELHKVVQQLLAAGTNGFDPFDRPPPPSQRRPRRSDVVTYQIRADLSGTKPPLWRRLDVASDLRLDEVHDVMQLAFGWTDSHLHRFGSGDRGSFSDETESYLCPWEIEEGETGIPEGEVRLDEVLVDVGDKLFYSYDYGDGWEHVLELEAVKPRDGHTARAVCTTGRRAGPAEDCGGVGGYELICAAIDATDPGHDAAVAEYARMFGNDVDPAWYLPTPFDISEINAALSAIGAGAPADLPARLAELVEAIRTAPGKTQLRRLIGKAFTDVPVEVDTDMATRMVRPYTWILHRVGADGIKLTGAGYLPPIHVRAAVTELGLSREWIGTNNRESTTLPVLHLRETAQKLGLLRKHRGQLLLTARGRAVRDDPVGLWWHLAERMPISSSDPCERQAGLLFLIAVAAAEPRLPSAADTTASAASQARGFEDSDLDDVVAAYLGAIGWGDADGAPMTGNMASHAAWDTKTVIRRLGGLDDRTAVVDAAQLHLPHVPDDLSVPVTIHIDVANTDGVRFARAALNRWADAPRD